MPTNAWNVSPTRRIWPHFSRQQRPPRFKLFDVLQHHHPGPTSSAQRMTIHASPRMAFSTGLAPFAFEKWRQSGKTPAYRRPAVALDS
jgi:hypothetical protein